MNPKRFIHTLLSFFLLLLTVIALSYITNTFWGNPPEREPDSGKFIADPNITVAAYGRINSIPPVVLIKIFGLNSEADSLKSLKDFSLTQEQLLNRTRVEISDYLEEHSKNPIRYTIHFIVYLVFLAFIFYLIYHSKITPSKQKWLYLAAILIFGFGFNSNPSPMGPLRDTIALFSHPVDIIHPRLFAILTFLVFVVVANKFICSWACQLGVLQDFIFRLNRSEKGCNAIFDQIKLPFFIANTIRICFFVIVLVSSILWAFNVIGRIDPFNVFNPAAANLTGWIFIISMLIISLFTYRPWCHLLCPFGLLGWFFEKISIFKIKVDYSTCTACGICSESCPSDVMEAILKGKPDIPDCFSCGTCITECPTASIKFDKGKRSKPPIGFFEPEVLKKMK